MRERILGIQLRQSVFLQECGNDIFVLRRSTIAGKKDTRNKVVKQNTEKKIAVITHNNDG